MSILGFAHAFMLAEEVPSEAHSQSIFRLEVDAIDVDGDYRPGSGFVISKVQSEDESALYVLTTSHVLFGSDESFVGATPRNVDVGLRNIKTVRVCWGTSDGQCWTIPKTNINPNRRFDVAVLRVPVSRSDINDFKPLSLKRTIPPSGSPVIASGFPGGERELRNVNGTLSAMRQFTVAGQAKGIVGGMSGGPLFFKDDVVAITVAGSETDDERYFLLINDVASWIEEFPGFQWSRFPIGKTAVYGGGFTGGVAGAVKAFSGNGSTTTTTSIVPSGRLDCGDTDPSTYIGGGTTATITGIDFGPCLICPGSTIVCPRTGGVRYAELIVQMSVTNNECSQVGIQNVTGEANLVGVPVSDKLASWLDTKQTLPLNISEIQPTRTIPGASTGYMVGARAFLECLQLPLDRSGRIEYKLVLTGTFGNSTIQVRSPKPVDFQVEYPSFP